VQIYEVILTPQLFSCKIETTFIIYSK